MSATPAYPLGRRFPVDTVVLFLLCIVVLSVQGIRVASSPHVVNLGNYDSLPHFQYFQHVWLHPDEPLAFRGSYQWRHFPTFYQWNALVAHVVCWFGAGDCPLAGVKVAWFLQAIVRIGTLAFLLATYRRLFHRAALAAVALALCATSPRVFLATTIWNQDDYVFFFAAACMYATVAVVQDGLTARRVALAALATAVGFAFKNTMAVPAVVMCGVFALLQARAIQKIAAFGVIAAVFVAVNWTLLTTAGGRERLLWTSSSYYANRPLHNQDAFAHQYLRLDLGPVLHPEPITILQPAGTGERSVTTCMYLYAFEPYEVVQGPPRSWLNLLCVWTGTPLLLVAFWRAGRALVGARSGAGLSEAYCAALVLLAPTVLLAFSLGFPQGWTPRPEYVLAAYPAAAALLVGQLLSARRGALFWCLAVLIGLHLTGNAALLVQTAAYRMGDHSSVSQPGNMRGASDDARSTPP